MTPTVVAPLCRTTRRRDRPGGHPGTSRRQRELSTARAVTAAQCPGRDDPAARAAAPSAGGLVSGPCIASHRRRSRTSGRGLSPEELVYGVLVRLPLGTVALEKIASAACCGPWLATVGACMGTVISSVLFGLWHAQPPRGVTRANAAAQAVFGDGQFRVALSAAAAVVGTTHRRHRDRTIGDPGHSNCFDTAVIRAKRGHCSLRPRSHTPPSLPPPRPASGG